METLAWIVGSGVAMQTIAPIPLFAWTLLGFVTFFAIEQFLHWHHCHRASAGCKKPPGPPSLSWCAPPPGGRAARSDGAR